MSISDDKEIKPAQDTKEKPQELQNAKLSPVSTVPNKNMAKYIFLGVAGIVVLYLFMFHSGSNKLTTPEEQQDNAPQVDKNKNAPKLTLSDKDVGRIQVAMQEINRGSGGMGEQEAKLQKMRMVAPVQVYASDGNNINVGGMAQDGSGGKTLGADGVGDVNSQFMNKVGQSSVPISKATKIAHPATTLVQGTMIWATLETRIISDLPGMVRAVTSEDIYSEDGSTVLLPRGSRLVGQYTNAIAEGQQRVFVAWQRAIRPDHIDIQIASPGTDPLGEAGVGADSINRHFFEQFGNAMLLSLIGASAANAGVNNDSQYNSSAAYREAIASSFANTAQQTLQATGAIKPTLYINQGRKISVFVARDLDFYDQLKDSNAS